MYSITHGIGQPLVADRRPLEQITAEILSSITPEKMMEIVFPDLERGKATGRTIEYGNRKNAKVKRQVVAYCACPPYWIDYTNGETGGDVFTPEDGSKLRGKEFAAHVIEIARELGIDTGTPETEADRQELERKHRERLAELDRKRAEHEAQEAQKKEFNRHFAGIIGQQFIVWHNNIAGNPSLNSLLEKRGFPLDLLSRFDNIGFVESNAFRSKTEDKPGYFIAGNSLVYVTRNDEGKIVGIKSIQHDETTGGRTGNGYTKGDFRFELKPKNAKPGVILLCEGETDTIAGALAGFHSISVKMGFDADSLPVDRVYWVCLDKDTDGDKQTNTIIAQLEKASLQYVDVRAALTKKDLNDLWRDAWTGSEGEDGTRAFVQSRIEQAASGADTIQPFKDKDHPTDEEMIAYCANNSKTSEFARFAYDDELIGGFIRTVDPFNLRGLSPVFCLIVWGIATLAKYKIDSDTNPRIINLVAGSSAGKDWIMGTLKSPKVSPGIMYQLNKIPGMDVDTTVGIGTGEGRKLEAFNWAKQPENAGKIRGWFITESGNSLERGYGKDERLGSVTLYDLELCECEIKKPNSKKDLKDLANDAPKYPYNGFEVRAYQDTNGAKILTKRVDSGGGEARREIWMFLPGINEVLGAGISDKATPAFKRLRQRSFTEEQCEKAYSALRKSMLPISPDDETFDGAGEHWIKTDFYGSPVAQPIYDRLVDSITNQLLRKDKCSLIQDRLQFFTGLSAGLHGRHVANDADWMIGAYFVECNAQSMNMILECDSSPTDPDSIYCKLEQRLQARGANGMRTETFYNGVDPVVLERFKMTGKIKKFRDGKKYFVVSGEFSHEARRMHPEWKPCDD